MLADGRTNQQPLQMAPGAVVTLVQLMQESNHTNRTEESPALVMQNYSTPGHPKRLVVMEGDVVLAGAANAHGWTYATRQSEHGYLPTSLLSTKSARVVAGFSPHGDDSGKQLKVEIGERVWILQDAGDWAYVAKPARGNTSNSGVIHGFVPDWTMTGFHHGLFRTVI
jgi:hypothetical protein